MSLKKEIIRSYIWSVVAYGSEAWKINKEVRNRMNAFLCWIHRRILNISMNDRVSNVEVLERMGINMHFYSVLLQREKLNIWTHLQNVKWL